VKHPSILVNNIINNPLILVAGLLFGLSGAVQAQTPGPGQFGGLGQGGAPTGMFPSDLRNMPPERRDPVPPQQGGTPAAQFPPDPRNAPIDQRITSPAATAGQLPADSRPGGPGQFPAHGGTGQPQGDLRSILGQKPPPGRTTAGDSKKTSSGQKRTYGSATSGKARRDSKDATYEDQRTYGSATREKGTSGAGDTYIDQSRAYGDTKARQGQSAAKDPASVEGRESERAAKKKAPSDAREASADERQPNAEGKSPVDPRRERPADSTGARPPHSQGGAASTPVMPDKKEPPKDPYEGIKLGK
jgi:hypothetical protein